MTGFETKILQHISKLTATPYPQLEMEVARKRLDWFAAHSPEFGTIPTTPRGAYEFLFRDYMGLDLADLPVVAESEDEIVWLSRNPCPTLEACVRIGLDTRILCRAVYERSTQVLISCIDPQLRFLRSYTEIRPHAGHCREWLVRLDFSTALAAAEEEARGAAEDRGAVVFLGRHLLGRAGGPSAAADALGQAVDNLGDEDLTGAVLFCTPEPGPDDLRWAASAHVTSVVWRVGSGRIEEFPAFPTVQQP